MFDSCEERAMSDPFESKAQEAVVKVGMVGDPSIGKTSLMIKYIENRFDNAYLQTVGVNFMEKRLGLGNIEVTCSIWDLGGSTEYHHLMPLVCQDAHVLLFIFDLSRKATLSSVKGWYKKARKYNKAAVPILVGTKFDLFTELSVDKQMEITKSARKYAAAMKCPLIFCSASHAINVSSIFKVVVSKVFGTPCSVKKITELGSPILEF